MMCCRNGESSDFSSLRSSQDPACRCSGLCLFSWLVNLPVQYFLKSMLILIMLESDQEQTEKYGLDEWMVQLLAKVTQIENELSQLPLDQKTHEMFTVMKLDLNKLTTLDLNMLPTRGLLLQAVDNFSRCFKVLSVNFLSFQTDLQSQKDSMLDRKDLIGLMELCTHMSSYLACLTHSLLIQLEDSFELEALKSAEEVQKEYTETFESIENRLSESLNILITLTPELPEYQETEPWLITRLDFICQGRYENWQGGALRKLLCHIASRYLCRVSQKLAADQDTAVGNFLEMYRPLLRSYCDERSTHQNTQEDTNDQEEQVELLEAPTQMNPAWTFDDSEVIYLANRLPDLLFMDTVANLLGFISRGSSKMTEQIIALTTENQPVKKRGFSFYFHRFKIFIYDSYDASFRAPRLLLMPLFIFRVMIWWRVVKNSTPPTAGHSVMDVLSYIEGQNNFVLAYLVVMMVIHSVKLLLERWLSTPMEQLEPATKITNLGYIRAVLFYAVITNCFGELASGRTQASVVFDAGLFEILALLDNISNLLISKSYLVSLDHSRWSKWSLKIALSTRRSTTNQTLSQLWKSTDKIKPNFLCSLSA